ERAHHFAEIVEALVRLARRDQKRLIPVAPAPFPGPRRRGLLRPGERPSPRIIHYRPVLARTSIRGLTQPGAVAAACCCAATLTARPHAPQVFQPSWQQS